MVKVRAEFSGYVFLGRGSGVSLGTIVRMELLQKQKKTPQKHNSRQVLALIHVGPSCG